MDRQWWWWWWWWSYENQCDMSVSKRLLEESLEVLWTECYDYINQDENANLNKSIYDNNFLKEKLYFFIAIPFPNLGTP